VFLVINISSSLVIQEASPFFLSLINGAPPFPSCQLVWSDFGLLSIIS
jgi:hypothetical protein